MAQITIDADGDYFLPTDSDTNVTNYDITTVMIVENSASATTEYGLADGGENFVAYPNGTIAVGDLIAHGKGVRLMVRVGGITSGSVTIFVNKHA